MITTDKNGARTFYGTSSDTKPSGADAANGSCFLEMDTGNVYFYDAEGAEWRVSPTSGGGGTSDYTDLENKPQINGVTLSGNKSTSDLGIDTLSLGISGAVAGNIPVIASVDGSGKPLSWSTTDVQHQVTVTAVTQDGVTVTGQTVTVREIDAQGEIFDTAAYDGQPVTFVLPVGFEYHISISSMLADHFNPTVATGIVQHTDISVVLTYSDFSTITSFTDIQAALDDGIDLSELVGKTIYTGFDGTANGFEWVVDDYDSTNKVIGLHAKYCVLSAQMEPQQALMWCENGLAAGSYKFKNSNNTYYFTLTSAIPAGGQLRAVEDAFQTYESTTATTALETGTVSTTEISGATDLGTCGTGDLNNMDRVKYGSNNIGESALLQHLNSSDPANTPVARLTKFSRPATYNMAGFLGRLDSASAACIANTAWKCSANNVYECPAAMGGIALKQSPYTVTAKVLLLSEMEVCGAYSGTAAGDSVLDYYNGAEAADRIMYNKNNQAQNWWLRSPVWNTASGERYVNTSGSAYTNAATTSLGVVPACKIAKSA